MTIFIRSMLILSLVLTGNKIYADDKPVKFENQVLEQRYYELIDEVRCLVCQNQSLADSNADLAQDLRNEIYEMLVAGNDNKQIMQFLVERYGDFVLYRPPLQENTWLLWFGPFLLLLICVVIAIIIIRKQSSESTTHISDKEQERLAEILKDESNGSKQ
jgi:cytochrome c-type biogenesis protein CcmH